jgi:hypothetical protein
MSIFSDIASVVAAPFTGGASLAGLLPDIFGAGGAALGAASSADAKNQGTQNQTLMDLANLQQRSSLSNEQGAVTGAQDARAALTDAIKKAQITQYLAGGATPFQVSGAGGPYAPHLPTSVASPEQKSAMAQVAASMNANLPMHGANAARPTPQFQPYTPPPISAFPGPSTGSSIMGDVGAGLTGLAAILAKQRNGSQ